MDKDLKTKIDEGILVGSRIAEALEKLVNEPLVEIKTPPPQCPHCGEINPDVNIYQIPEGAGKISTFLIQAKCMHCNRDIYCLSLEWSLQPDENSALIVGREIVERMNNVYNV